MTRSGSATLSYVVLQLRASSSQFILTTPIQAPSPEISTTPYKTRAFRDNMNDETQSRIPKANSHRNAFASCMKSYLNVDVKSGAVDDREEPSRGGGTTTWCRASAGCVALRRPTRLERQAQAERDRQRERNRAGRRSTLSPHKVRHESGQDSKRNDRCSKCACASVHVTRLENPVTRLASPTPQPTLRNESTAPISDA
jgi:hypothetical protein